MSTTIKCELCGEQVHSIQIHLGKAHSGMSLEQYQARFPNSPILSDTAKELIEKKNRERAEAEAAKPLVLNHAHLAEVTPISAAVETAKIDKKPMHEVFGLPLAECQSGRGTPIPISVMTPPASFQQYVPDTDDGHVWQGDDLKNMMLAVEFNMPLYVWGHKGTGKTTDLEQIAARTGRPMMRVQHTINTEESHIIGQWTVKGGETVFELGPLAIAMKYGYVYLADEYDFALASVLSVYQPVLEGKSLLIKEADAANRIVKPHPMFRFWATGNTNGSGDDTGLYQGTSVQNAANYDRFAMVIQKFYMPADRESKIVQNRAGISEKEAVKLINFATSIRKEFDAGKLSDTISTRALVNIALIGLRKGNMRAGIDLCYGNKLCKVDREAIKQVAQRIYG